MAHDPAPREFILLTVLAEGSKQLATPEVRAFPWRNITNILRRPSPAVGTSITVDGKGYIVAENAIQMDLLTCLVNPAEEYESLTQVGIDAIGTAQGDGVDVLAPTYYAEIDAATDTSAEAVDIVAEAVPGAVLVMMNNTAVVLEVYPVSDESIDGAAANAKYDHGILERVTYYCKVAGAWIICTNRY